LKLFKKLKMEKKIEKQEYVQRQNDAESSSVEGGAVEKCSGTSLSVIGCG
jgi:hypothetical protein